MTALLYVVLVGLVVVVGFTALLRRRVDEYERRPRLPAPEDADTDVAYSLDEMIAAVREREAEPIVGWGFTTADARRTVRQEVQS